MNFIRKLLGNLYDIPFVKFIFEIFFIILPIAFAIRTFLFGLYQVPTGSMEPTLLVGERFFADKLSYWFRSPRRGEIIAFNEPRYPYSSNPLVKLWQMYVSWNVSNWTKRVIGVPHDHIKGTIENGRPVIYINGKKLEENYINKYPLIGVWKYSHYSNPDSFKEMENDKELKTFDPKLPWDKQPFYKVDPSRIILNNLAEPYIFWPFVPEPKKDIFEYKLAENEYFVCGDNRRGSSDSREWGILNGSLIHGRIIYRIWSMDSDEQWWFIDLIKHPIEFWYKVRWSRCFQWVK